MEIIETAWDWAGTLSGLKSAETLIFHHAAADCTAADVHRWHLSRGWLGIGYHYFVDKAGRVWRGRPESAAGAHCLGKNFSSLGVCFEGNFEEETMPEAQRRAGAELAADILGRYPAMRPARHSDFDATACPGRNFPFAELAGAAEPPFPDAAGHWALEEIRACSEAGVLKGRGDGLFHPDECATRAELAAALARLLRLCDKNTKDGA